MTDARLLSNAELLLRWSASLDYNRLAFDNFVKEEFDELSGSSCADAAGHSVRVSDRLVPSSR